MLTTSDALARWLTKPGRPRFGPSTRRDRCFPECAASPRRITRGAPVRRVAWGLKRALLPTRTDPAGAVRPSARDASEPIASRRRHVVPAGARGNRASGETGASDDGAALAATLAVLGAAARNRGESARRGDVTGDSDSEAADERNGERRDGGRRRRRRRSSGSVVGSMNEDVETAASSKPKPRGERKPRARISPKGDRPAGFDDDGGWRHRSKRALRDDIARYVDVATAALEAERQAEAAAAAAMSQSEAGGDVRATASDVDRDVPEGTIVGRAGAMMDGMRLTSARPGSVKGGRLLNLRVEGGGALPPSALAVGDRVAAVLVDNCDDDDSGFVSMRCDADEAPWSLSDAEAVISEIDPANGVLTLLETTRKDKPKAAESLNEMLARRKSLEELMGGRLVRLVRVPDATTYERQIAALRTLRNVPTSRTNPPSLRIVRALFASARCPPADADAAEAASATLAADAHATRETLNVAGHFATALDVAEATSGASSRAKHGTAKAMRSAPLRALGPDQLPPLDVRPAAEGGGGPLPAGFDDAQALAVRAALCDAAPVCWIQGPPGTGKTKVVIEIIRRAVASGSRVLACAPSNAAVDNLVERLAETRRVSGGNDDGGATHVSFVRVGAPERISDAALENALEARVRDATAGYFDQARSTRRRELVDATRRGWEKRDELRRRGGKSRRGSRTDDASERRVLDKKLASLRLEQKKMAGSGRKTRAKAEREVLANVDVVLATAVGAGAENIQKLPAFDLLVLDEAAQATEPAAWIPLVRCARAVLVGDPRQLAPLVRSEAARAHGLETSIMTRVSVPQQRRAETRASAEAPEDAARAFLNGGVLGCALRTQYRSHAAISDWASRETYGGALVASPRVATGLLRDLPGVDATAATSAPLLLLDTRVASGALLGGCAEATERRLLASLSDYGSADEIGVGGGGGASLSSLVNEGEAYAVTMHVAGLLRAGVAPAQIAVQSPYAAQVRLMQRRLREADRVSLAPGAERVEVASVDSFQGREAEAVVISTVRSNERRAVGFLADARRANVAVTRARRHVAVVGDSRTIGADPFLARLLAHICENGARSPADEHARLHEPLE